MNARRTHAARSAATARLPTSAEFFQTHSLAESFALAARVTGRVVSGSSLTAALAAQRGQRPALRAAAQDLCYRTLRGWGRFDVLAARLLEKPLEDGVLYGLVLVALAQLAERAGSAHAVVHQAVEAASVLRRARARGLVNAVLRSYQRRAPALEAEIRATETGRYAHPQWWIDRLKSAYPGRWQAILEQGNTHPPMTLRVNLRRISVSAYLSRLQAAGLAARSLGGAAVILDRPVRIEALPGFSAGAVSVQDAGAQRAAPLLEVRAGMRVLDACAAPGGKAAHILELADCALTAVDVTRERARLIHQNLKRLGLSADVLLGDSRHPETFAKRGQFERILLDAPCSASGVVRRHPDIKWLRRASDIEGFVREQRSMLEALWRTLAAGGKLLYATCSVFPEENRLQVREFLARHVDARELRPAEDDDGLILPDAESDGFYYALLHKIR